MGAGKLLAGVSRGIEQTPAEIVRRLVHQLHVNQVELEVQNEELRRTQLELEAARDRYADLYNFAPIAHMTLSADGKILEANLKAGQLLEVNRGRLIRQKFTRFIMAESQNTCHVLCHQIFSSDARHTVEMNLKTARGNRLVVQVEAVRDAKSRRKQCRFSFTDITGRKRAEEALLESSQFNQQIIAGAREGIVVNGPDLKHLVWNPFMEELTGVPAAKVMDKHPAEVFPFLKKSGIINQLNRALKGEAINPVEVHFHVPQSGKAGWASNSCSPLRNGRGEIIGVINMITDITGRKRSEEALLAREAQLRSFVQAAPASIAMFDREMNYVAVSRRWTSDHGHGHRNLVGLNHYKVNPDLPHRWKVIHQRGLAGETLSCDEDLWMKADGTRAWFHWSVNPWLDARGKIGGIMILAENISPRKEAEALVRESEARYRALFDRAVEGIFLLSEAGEMLSVNESFARMHGYSAKEMLDLKLEDLDADESCTLAPQRLSRLLAGEALTFEVKHHHRDGHVFPLEVSASRISVDGKFLIQCFHRDITERKHAEDLVRREKEFSEGIIATAQTIILILDAKGRIIRFNPYLEKLTGYRSAEMAGKDWFESFLPKTDRKRIRRIFFKSVDGDHVQGLINPILTRDGKFRTIEWHDASLRNARGGVMGILAVGQDITDRRHSEERIAKLNRVQSILSGVDRAIVHITDRQKLLDTVCRVAVEKGGFKLSWVGMVSRDGTVQPVARAGAVKYLDDIRVVVTSDVPEGRGPVGTAIRENRPVVVEDITEDQRMTPWRDRAQQFELNYVAAFPLRIAGQVAGSFQVYAPRPGFFDKNELELLTQVSDELSYALTAINNSTGRKEAEEALRRSEHHLSNFFNQAPIGLVWLSASGTILRANQAQLDLLGCRAENVPGHSFNEFIADRLRRLRIVEAVGGQGDRAQLAVVIAVRE